MPGQYLAYNLITRLFWSGLGFDSNEASKAKALDAPELAFLRHVYLNVGAVSITK